MRTTCTRAAVAAVLAACLAGAPLAAGAATSAPSSFDPAGIIIQAHRGGPALGAPENSIALFKRSVASTAVDRIETDVRSTQDDVLVIMHDEKLPVTCTSAGRAVASLTWAELSRVRCDGEPVPRLTELLDVVRGSTVSLNLELKLDTTMSSSAKSAFAKRAVTTVLAADLPRAQVGFSSYYWRSYASTVQKYGKGTTMTAMEFPTRTEPTDDVFATVRRAKAAGVDSFAIAAKHTNQGVVDYIRGYGGMRLGTQDRTTEEQTRYALDQGSWTFTSDDPVRKRRDVDALLERVRLDPLRLTLVDHPVPHTIVLKPKAMKKSSKTFPRVIAGTGLVPVAAAEQLHGIAFTVKITGKGSGKLELAPSGSRPGIDGVRIAIPNGTRTYTMYACPGAAGKIRVMTTGTATVTLTMTGYQTAQY